MISQEIVTKTHNAVCAIGILPVELNEWRLNPEEHPLQVLGSGFLIRADVVVTNHHVLEHILAKAEEFEIPDSQLFLSFVAPSRLPGPIGTVRMIRHRHRPEGDELDIVLLEIKPEPEVHFIDIDPLPVSSAREVLVSEGIFVCGYPYGNMLLQPRNGHSRSGPVIQQGYISGLSPFAGSSHPDELLLDVRTADKMSGSPVIRSITGEVIGIHHKGTIDSKGITTTSFAIPLESRRVANWLKLFDEEIRDA